MVVCVLLAISCVSQEPKKVIEPASTEIGIPKEPINTGSSASLDLALSDIAAYYVKNIPSSTKIALLNFEAETQLLSDYIFEELWISFEDSRSFILVDRKNLELIEKEMSYQYSGMVSDESMQSLGHQLGAQTLSMAI